MERPRGGGAQVASMGAKYDFLFMQHNSTQDQSTGQFRINFDFRYWAFSRNMKSLKTKKAVLTGKWGWPDIVPSGLEGQVSKSFVFIKAISVHSDHCRAMACRIGVTLVLGEIDVTRRNP